MREPAPPAARDPFGLVGQVLSQKYRVDGVVGQGGYGVVYRATHLLLGGQVAVKCMKPDALAGEGPGQLQQFLREAQLLFGLNHPHIVRMYDVGTLQLASGQSAFLVLELLGGGSLADDIQRRRSEGRHYGLGELHGLIWQVGSAMDAAHQAGVVHRDLKPANVMLQHNGQSGALQAKVLDFGIARGGMTTGQTTTGAPFTPRYASPEQWNRQYGPVSFQSDVFSFGLLVWELALLRPAFTGESIGELLTLAINPQARPRASHERPDLPPGFDDLLLRATAVQPGERFGSVAQLRDALCAQLSGASSRQPYGPAAVPGLSHTPQTPHRPGLAQQPHASITAPAVSGSARLVPNAQAGRGNSVALTVVGVAAILALFVLGVFGIGVYALSNAIKTALSPAPAPTAKPASTSASDTGGAPGSKTAAPWSRPLPSKTEGRISIHSHVAGDKFRRKADERAVLLSALGAWEQCYLRSYGRMHTKDLLMDVTISPDPGGKVSHASCSERGLPKTPKGKAACQCISASASDLVFSPARRWNLLKTGPLIVTLRFASSGR